MAIVDVLNAYNSEHDQPRGSSVEEALKGTLKASGGSGGVLVVNVSESPDVPGDFQMDRTWQEIHDAMSSGTVVVAIFTDTSRVDMAFLTQCGIDEGDYSYYVSADSTGLSFYCTGPDDYPVSHVG